MFFFDTISFMLCYFNFRITNKINRFAIDMELMIAGFYTTEAIGRKIAYISQFFKCP